MINKHPLLKRALQAMEKAYAPYSNFKVGAAVLAEDGKIYEGANMENSSYSLTCCAERVAIFHALAHGQRKIKEMAVIGHTDEPIQPCGACRQVMAELLAQDTPVWLASTNGKVMESSIEQLLPNAFSFKHKSEKDTD